MVGVVVCEEDGGDGGGPEGDGEVGAPGGVGGASVD